MRTRFARRLEAAAGPRFGAEAGEWGSVAESAAMRRVRRQIEEVAPTRATVLFTGETGTGKGHAARQLHARSPQSDAPFVHVDCASLSASVIESELFGHERGAFTGAHERRIGRFERAGEGTIFLDEIAEVAPELQAKLLRVLEEREFERVGGNAVLPVRARIVAATNRELRREIAEGRFRQDLFYRLQVFEVRLPALRERLEELPWLVADGLEQCRTALGVGGGAPVPTRPDVTPAFLEQLAAHAWPGNIRELRNVLERVSISNPLGPWDARDAEAALGEVAPGEVAPGEAVLDAVALGDAALAISASGRKQSSAAERCAAMPLRVLDSRRRFETSERLEVARALEAHRWNVSEAARSLGLSRGALRGRMARLGLR